MLVKENNEGLVLYTILPVSSLCSSLPEGFFFLIECIPLSEAAEKQHHHPPAFTLHTPLNTIKNVFTFFFSFFSLSHSGAENVKMC